MSIFKLAAEHITDYPVTTFEESQVLTEKVAAAIMVGRSMGKSAGLKEWAGAQADLWGESTKLRAQRFKKKGFVHALGGEFRDSGAALRDTVKGKLPLHMWTTKRVKATSDWVKGRRLAEAKGYKKVKAVKKAKTIKAMAKEAANPLDPYGGGRSLVRKWINPGKNPFLPSAMEAAKKKEILKRLGPGYKRALDSGLISKATKKG